MKKRVRAVIIKDRKILLVKRTKPDSIYWVIPGGAVEEGESNEQALLRESKEELGVDVKIGDLILEMKSEKLENKGQREYFYFCNIIDGELGTGQGPEYQKDTGYVGRHDIEWINIDNIKNLDLKPQAIKDFFIDFLYTRTNGSTRKNNRKDK